MMADQCHGPGDRQTFLTLPWESRPHPFPCKELVESRTPQVVEFTCVSTDYAPLNASVQSFQVCCCYSYFLSHYTTLLSAEI